MALAAFDTLEFVDTLEKAGISEPQARAISVAVRKAYESSDVATKGDIAGLHRDAKQAIADLRRDTKQDIADLRHEIGDLRKDMVAMEQRSDAKFDVLRVEMTAIKWGLGIIGGGIIALLVKAFF